MIRKSPATLVGLLLVTAVALTACGGAKKTPAAPPAQNQPGTPKKAAFGGEWIRPLDAEPDSFHYGFLQTAYGSAVAAQILGCGLLDTDEKWNPRPCLAKEMPKVSADNKEYTFTLRDNILFHDGTPMTAADVEYTFNDFYLNKDYTGSASNYMKSVLESVKATDAKTVVFKLKNVYAPFLTEHPQYPIFSKNYYGKVAVKDQEKHEIAMKPMGAGPYTLKEYKQGQYVLLEAFEKYHKAGGEKDGPFIKNVRMKIIPDDNTRIAALEAGETQACLNCPPQHVDRLKQTQTDKLIAYDWPRNGFGHIRFNNEKWPTSEKVVRQALTLAINRPAIIQGVLNGKAIVPPGPIPNPVSPWYNQNLKPAGYDPKAAEKLLDEAGYVKGADGVRSKDGKRLTLSFNGTKGSPIIDGISLQAQKDWKAIGVETKIELVDFNTLLANHVRPGNFHAAFFATGPGLDPDGLYTLLHSSEAKPDAAGQVKGSNTARFRNTRIDQLLEKGRTTIDRTERKKIYDEVQAIFSEEAPWILMYSNMYTDFVAKKVQGVTNVPGYGVSYMQQWFIETK